MVGLQFPELIWLVGFERSSAVLGGVKGCVDLAHCIGSAGVRHFATEPPLNVTSNGTSAAFTVTLYMQGGLPEIGFDQTGLVHFSAQVGAAAPPPSILTGGVNLDGATVVVSTADGGHWLSASLSPPNLSISVNPVGLAPGDYTGLVTFVSTTAYSPPIPVWLTVYKAPALSVVSHQLDVRLVLSVLRPDAHADNWRHRFGFQCFRFHGGWVRMAGRIPPAIRSDNCWSDPQPLLQV
jgi:hypothetical protein